MSKNFLEIQANIVKWVEKMYNLKVKQINTLKIDVKLMTLDTSSDESDTLHFFSYILCKLRSVKIKNSRRSVVRLEKCKVILPFYILPFYWDFIDRVTWSKTRLQKHYFKRTYCGLRMNDHEVHLTFNN